MSLVNSDSGISVYGEDLVYFTYSIPAYELIDYTISNISYDGWADLKYNVTISLSPADIYDIKLYLTTGNIHYIDSLSSHEYDYASQNWWG